MGGEQARVPAPGARGRARWWRWFLLLAALCIAWGFATPLLASPDEGAHIIRAAAIGRGQLSGPDVFTGLGFVTQVRVPGTFKEMTKDAPCFAKHPDVTPTCVKAVPKDSKITPVTTVMGRYPPLYYLIVAAPLRAFPSDVGIHLMRIVAALLCAAFLASAFVSAEALGRWAVLGVLVAITPMTVYLSGVVNPSGLEIVTAICLWATMAAVAVGPRVDVRLVVRAAVAFAFLANTRGLSLPMAAVAVVLPLLLANRSRLAELVRSTPVRVAVVITAVAGLVALAWDQLRGHLPASPFAHVDFTFQDGVSRSWRLFQESVAWFGTFEVRDLAVIVIWVVLWTALLIIGLRAGTRRAVVVLAAVVLVAFFFPIVVSVIHPPPIYANWQGRHGLPLWVGVPVVAGAIASISTRIRRVPPTAAIIAFAGAFGYGQLSAFMTAAHRYTVGTSGRRLYFLDPIWRGSLPPWLLLLVAVAAVAALSWQSTGFPIRAHRRRPRRSDGPRPGASPVATAP